MVIGLCYDLLDTYDISSKAEYRDFSLLSEVEFVEIGLKKLGHKVILINGLDKFAENIQKYKNDCDIIFNMIEGYKSRNRESLLPALCEAFDIAYTGSDAFGLSLSLNKYHMNRFVESLGIHTPSDILIEYPIMDIEHLCNYNLSYPCIIKPNHEGSSMGVYLINSEEELIEKAKYLSTTYTQQLIIEEYIKGMELSIGILGTAEKSNAYMCFEFLNENGSDIEVLDYNKKYNEDTQSIAPRLGKKVIDRICECSLKIHKTIGFRDISRIDWRVRENVPYFIEATPLPSFKEDLDFDLASKEKGKSFDFVLSEILNSALERKNGKWQRGNKILKVP